jgi:hypothetical protein
MVARRLRYGAAELPITSGYVLFSSTITSTFVYVEPAAPIPSGAGPLAVAEAPPVTASLGRVGCDDCVRAEPLQPPTTAAARRTATALFPANRRR